MHSNTPPPKVADLFPSTGAGPAGVRNRMAIHQVLDLSVQRPSESAVAVRDLVEEGRPEDAD